MKYLLLITVVWGLLISSTRAAEPDSMEQAIEGALEGFEGTVWIYAKNLDTGAEFSLHGDERVRTASTIKLPILIALNYEIEAGRVKWDETLTLTKDVRTSGSGILHEFEDGHRLSVREASRLMMVLSDNIATNLILGRITADVVNDRMEELGLEKSRCLRRIGGGGESKAFSQAFNKRADGSSYGIGCASPQEMVVLLGKLHRGEIVSPEASKEILAVMSRQQPQNGIARQLQGMHVAAKSGALDRLRSEVGLVTGRKGPIAIAVTIDDMPASNWSVDNPGLIMIGQLSALLVEGLGGE